MDSTWIAKQIINFQKTTFNNTCGAMNMLQEHTEIVTATIFEQANWLPEEGNRVFNQWNEIYKKSRDDFKTAVDDNFNMLTHFFSQKKSK